MISLKGPSKQAMEQSSSVMVESSQSKIKMKSKPYFSVETAKADGQHPPLISLKPLGSSTGTKRIVLKSSPAGSQSEMPESEEPEDTLDRASRTTPYERWEKNKKSIRKSVNAKCFDCVCGERYSTRIKYCCVFGCPLWFVRPYSKGVSKAMCEAHDESKVIYTANKRPEIAKKIIFKKK